MPDVDDVVFGDISVLGVVQPAMASMDGCFRLAANSAPRVARTVHRVLMAGFRFFNIYGQRQDPFAPNCGVISIFASKMEPRLCHYLWRRRIAAGRALIEAVHAAADDRGVDHVYRLNQCFNAAGRRIYDRVGRMRPFIKYHR